MRFGSVCSGIEAASVAWTPLGWEASWFAEIEPFPSAVLAYRFPEVPNLGDMTTLPDRIRSGEVEAPDVLAGGTPCQAFSVAGLRRSLEDERGNLSLTFCEIANAIDDIRRDEGRDPSVVFWENVPGVLSTRDNAFGCLLAGLAGESEPLLPAGGKWTNAGAVFGPERAVAWRLLDAQYFGLAQRRRRVFVVASARDGFDPAAILFEREGVRRDTAPSREAGKGTAARTGAGAAVSSGHGYWLDAEERAATLRAQDSITKADTLISQPYAVMSSGQANAEIRTDGGAPTLTCVHEAPIVAHSLRGEGFDASEDGTGRGTPGSSINASGPTVMVPVAFQQTADCLTAAYGTKCNGNASATNGSLFAEQAMQVRRLTPVECERLQGFPDNYTAIPWRKKSAEECPDGPRYKALGNSWAVPVVRWIGARIDAAIRSSVSDTRESAR